MNSLLQDVRYALRMLRRSPGFTLIAVLALALGIGANTTIYSWINSVLLNPLPGVERPHEIVAIYPVNKAERYLSVSYPDFRDWRDRSKSFAGLVANEQRPISLAAEGQPPERAYAGLVSGDFLGVLGVRPILGRGFLPEEYRTPGTHPVILLSETAWRNRFRSDPQIVGRKVLVNNQPFTVVGVLPRQFLGVETALAMDAHIPMMMEPRLMPGDSRLEARGHRWFPVVGRLKPGVTVEQAQAEMKVIARQLAEQYPQTNEDLDIGVFSLTKAPRGAIATLGPVLFVLMALVGVVLLIACANVANLMLSRSAARRREMAIRAAIGAGRWRMIRQMLTESVVLALLAGLAGVSFASWSSGLLMWFVPATDLPIMLPLGIDRGVLAFSLALSLATGVLFGLAPAVQASRRDVVGALKDETGTVAGGRGKSRFRNSLVVAQVALSLLLLISAGLFTRSLRKAAALDPGFQVDNLLLTSVDLFTSGYRGDQNRELTRQMARRLETLPGVESVAMARRVPLSLRGTSSTSIKVEGYDPAKGEPVFAYYNVVSPGYLRTMGIPLASGREFTEDDGQGKPLTILVNETMAKRYWPGGDAVGKRIDFGYGWAQVVGVARNITYHRLAEETPPYMYLSLWQFPQADLVIHARSAMDPGTLAAAIRNEVRVVAPALPVFEIRTMREALKAASLQQRIAASLLAALGMLALLLAAVGIYGVLAFSVTQRTHEFGVRMALGAQTGDILRLVLRQGALLTAIGVALGLGGALTVTRLMAKLLYGVGPTDPVTFAGLSVLLAVVALLACYLPARRAGKLDPLAALRYE